MASGFPPPEPRMPRRSIPSIVPLPTHSTVVYEFAQAAAMPYDAPHYARLHVHINAVLCRWEEVLCCDVTSPPLAGVITITMKPGYAIEPEWVDYFSDYVLHTTWHLPEVTVYADGEVVTPDGAVNGEEEA